MTPKDKAIELLNKLTFYTMAYSNSRWVEDKHSKKQCALIVVQEILELYKMNWNIENSYWLDVKKEIENI